MKAYEGKEIAREAREAATGSELSVLMGEFSATYFGCECCPAAVKKFMPNLRPIVLLRDPVARAQSRYLEQSDTTNPRVSKCGEDFQNETYAHIIGRQLHSMQRCMESVAAAPNEEGGQLGTQPPTKLGAEATPARKLLAAAAAKDASSSSSSSRSRSLGESETRSALEIRAAADDDEGVASRCLDTATFLGPSEYDVYLRLWLHKYPDTLVLYTDELDERPAHVMKLVERHLGLTPYEGYQGLNVVFNQENHWGWNSSATNADEAEEEEKEVEPAAATGAPSSGELKPELAETAEDAATTRDLVEWYAPAVRRMHALAETGAIRPVPRAWLERYAPDAAARSAGGIAAVADTMAEPEAEAGAAEEAAWAGSEAEEAAWAENSALGSGRCQSHFWKGLHLPEEDDLGLPTLTCCGEACCRMEGELADED